MRYEPTDHEWTAIRPMLPNKPLGVPRVNDRRILHGIFWVFRSGAPWRDLPDILGPYVFGPYVPMMLVSIGICQIYVWLRYF